MSTATDETSLTDRQTMSAASLRNFRMKCRIVDEAIVPAHAVAFVRALIQALARAQRVSITMMCSGRPFVRRPLTIVSVRPLCTCCR